MQISTHKQVFSIVARKLNISTPVVYTNYDIYQCVINQSSKN